MFYIIERKEQLSNLRNLGDCFVRFISRNSNYHPKLSTLSLVYIRSLTEHKGYILCIDHSESFQLDYNDVLEFLEKHTQKLFVTNKKEAMFFYKNHNKLYDIQFIENFNYEELLNNKCIKWYFGSNNTNLPNLNCLVPISKHYEECEDIFEHLKNIIAKYKDNDQIYKFNNTILTEAFYNIEDNGVKLDRKSFIAYYANELKFPEFNAYKGKIYTQYNLYTTTGRPSNHFNNINFAALNKDNGQREIFTCENDYLIELDINGMHPRIAGELVDFELPYDQNIYQFLDIEKIVMFENLYGYIRKEYKNHPFFSKIQSYIDDQWDIIQYKKILSTPIKEYKNDIPNLNPQKLFNYIIQSYETYNNVLIINKINDYLKDKKTKLVLYTYDAFLLDYSQDDNLKEIIELIKYPVSIKCGKSYNCMQKF